MKSTGARPLSDEPKRPFGGVGIALADDPLMRQAPKEIGKNTMNTTTNTNRPATAAEALATLLPEDDGLPITREGLEALIRELGRAASEIEDQMRRPAKVLTAPAMPRAIRRALDDLEALGAEYAELRDRERRAELKLRCVEQVEGLYADE